MPTGTYTYGTKPPMEEMPEIGLVRNFATQHLDGEGSHVHVTQHALVQASKRKIKIRKAIEIISGGYFVEYQEVPPQKKKPDATVFYDGHASKIISINSVADLTNQLISLITVEHRDDSKWNVNGKYITRK